MPLTIAQKKHVLTKVREISPESICAPLEQLIKNGVKIPVISKTSPLKEFITAYEAAKLDDASQGREFYAPLQLNMIKHNLQETGCQKLMEALGSDSMNAESLSDAFLEHLSTHFNWPLTVEPSVKLTIVKGKVYWRIIQNDAVLYDNETAKGNESSGFLDDGATVTVTMSWANFRRFKDAGKRTSSVEITPERFRAECTKLIPGINKIIPQTHLKQPSVIDAIWSELKEKGLLSENNRLTHAWYSLSGKLCLDSVSNIANDYRRQADKKEVGFLYTYTSTALKNASVNRDYKKALFHNHELFRPARTFINWSSTGTREYTDKHNPVQPWDVSSYLELQKHEVSGDELDHDHIPSKFWIKKDIDQQLETYRDIDAEQCNEEKERHTHWGCIEAPTQMHHSGETHSRPARSQHEIEKPFYEEINDYLNQVIAVNPDPQDLIQVIGAFRYLFSCHIKQKFSKSSYGFFKNRPDLVDQIDALLLEKLSQFSAEL
ncbi:MAG: hypothetical protein P1U39_05500 [Legionellaceae bacterium]|nr:hypothetical protein [Legionellaceae bacterium]